MLVWIFYHKANNEGVSNEFGRLMYLVSEDKLWNSLVFLEVTQLNRKLELSSMITGIIDRFKTIQCYEFIKSNDKKLLGILKGRLPDYVNTKLLDFKLK